MDSTLLLRATSRLAASCACGERGHHGVDVEDEGDAAVAEDGGGGDARHVAVVRLEALDDDLALALDRVDQQRALAAAFGFDQQGDAVDRVGLGARGSRAMRPTSISGHEGVADRDEPVVGAEGSGRLRLRLQRLDDGRQRQRPGSGRATVTTMPSSTASVSGRLIVKVEPWPGLRGDR